MRAGSDFREWAVVLSKLWFMWRWRRSTGRKRPWNQRHPRAGRKKTNLVVQKLLRNIPTSRASPPHPGTFDPAGSNCDVRGGRWGSWRGCGKASVFKHILLLFYLCLHLLWQLTRSCTHAAAGGQQLVSSVAIFLTVCSVDNWWSGSMSVKHRIFNPFIHPSIHCISGVVEVDPV